MAGAGRWRWPAKLAKRLNGVGAHDLLDLFVHARTRGPATESLVNDFAPPNHLLADRTAWPDLADPLQIMMHLDFAGYLVDDTQVKLDRASMAVGLEMRCPLLDQALIEFAWSLPLELRAGSDGSKPLLRHALQRHLPRALFERPKRGFGVPVASWLRDPLRHWGEDLLGEERLRREGHFQPTAVRTLWQQHQEGWQNHQEVLWHILMFQTWHEAWSQPSETRSTPLTDEVSMTAGPEEVSGETAAS